MVAGHIAGMGIQALSYHYCYKITKNSNLCSPLSITLHEITEPIVDSTIYPLMTKLFSASQEKNPNKDISIWNIITHIEPYELLTCIATSLIINKIVRQQSEKYFSDNHIDYIIPISGLTSSYLGSLIYEEIIMASLNYKNEIVGFSEEIP